MHLQGFTSAMDINLSDDPKISVAAKIPTSWSEEIDELCELSGITKSQWVANLIGDTLGKFNNDVASIISNALNNGSSEVKRKAIKKLLNLIAQSV